MRTYKRALSVVISAACVAFSANSLAATWKMAIGDAAGGTQYELGKSFAEEIEKRTDGKYKINLFPNGQLGSEEDTINNASMGLLDFSILAVNNITPFSPNVGVLTLPYVIHGAEDAKLLTQGEIGKQLADDTIRDAGVRILGWAYSGCRRLTNSVRAVESPADLKGLVIRVPKNGIMIGSYQAWGVNPTPMAWSETFTALQQGVVHGQDNPYITIDAMKFYEVQKYITDSCYVFSLEPLVMGEGVFQSLSPEMQTTVIEAGKAATEHSYAYLQAKEQAIKKSLVEERGMTIVQPKDNESEWIAQATKIWPKFYKSIGGKDKLDRVLSTLGRDPAPEK
ncbi:C4-dicarboxylate ABC transporter substrate-binding protein [Thiopseudomonas alkaliphila]|uniref:TRAP transporter substrate-binding protein n=1 Tax=Thiopseudomonas alkaliphila TaxID=1697053 RepID=UPI00069F4C53|nr:TRAP transporter substrate-binding protein [Thiopseudomonas alkaliphila]AKX45000.1 C4-dicarboxylate ABC transporter substrate-binding protein [Thiopseudomonas alkaliphila]AKX47486.1 C4-dicarboxylate ABC transporter substrate-binding protein [Thiopseudomonas alkaliphila]AKX48307.1 C4-dicarboxylate ABC transporter substrate-binding protein [Thiopseudomonas alkaliphila]AKX53436.1 C4-dicarboxylate ABC transporter substrate-binding protein [Thiopseudomonas alkaliphila]